LIRISGDLLEGGGQIVRTSVALAALTGKEVCVDKIRDKRPKPGLQAQHVTAVRALAAMCNAETESVEQGSREIQFKPRGHIGGRFNFDVGTAGSIPLILQALMPCAVFAPSRIELELTGGTDVRWSPTIDYVRLVVLPVLQLMGYRACVQVLRRGHYPKGGGHVRMTIEPVPSLNALKLVSREKVFGVEGISHCVKLPSHVAQRQATSAKEKLASAGHQDARIAVETYPPNQDPHIAPGSGITLIMKSSNGSIIGADSIGERGKPAETVGEEAAVRLLGEIESKAPIDRHLGDILIPYLAVAEGRSEISVSQITMHTVTNIKVAEMVSGVQFDVQGELQEPGTISVQGIALKT
jgi:RNA 3'-terminal phosphate cyclase (ATP)